MKKQNNEKGRDGENLASVYLSEKGHCILARNYRKRTGEIDIISCYRETIIFTEVKLRRTINYGTPAQAVNDRKQQHIIKTALWYLQEKKLFDCNVRFDIIEILGEPIVGYSINHIENAFLMEH
ncbi:MAG: YraN family protein [Eubacterium sp.]